MSSVNIVSVLSPEVLLPWLEDGEGKRYGPLPQICEPRAYLGG